MAPPDPPNPSSSPHRPVVTLFAAMSENRVIGRAGALPWRLPADLQRFKRRTTGRTIVMGRRTWESLPKRPLPNRRNVVLSRAPSFRAEGAEVAHDLESALRLTADEPEVFIIGGEEIFRLALPHADRIERTLVHATVQGDASFPELDASEWEIAHREPHDADERNEHPWTVVTYQRRDQ